MHDDEIVGGETVNSNTPVSTEGVQPYNPNPELKNDDELENPNEIVQTYRHRMTGAIVAAVIYNGENNVQILDLYPKKPIGHHVLSTHNLEVRTDDGVVLAIFEIGDFLVMPVVGQMHRVAGEQFYKWYELVPTVEHRPLKKIKRATTPTHNVSLSVMISTPDEHKAIFGLFTDMLEELSDGYGNVMLHSVDLAEDEEESLPPIDREEEDGADEYIFERLDSAYRDTGVPERYWSELTREIYRKRLIVRDRSKRLTHNEETLFKVKKGLEAAGITGDLLIDCINQVQNQGILFRERASD